MNIAAITLVIGTLISLAIIGAYVFGPAVPW